MAATTPTPTPYYISCYNEAVQEHKTMFLSGSIHSMTSCGGKNESGKIAPDSQYNFPSGNWLFFSSEDVIDNRIDEIKFDHKVWFQYVKNPNAWRGKQMVIRVHLSMPTVDANASGLRA